MLLVVKKLGKYIEIYYILWCNPYIDLGKYFV